MTSRERVRTVLEHRGADRIPLDLGANVTTGIQPAVYRQLKDSLGIDSIAIRIHEPWQVMAEVEEEVKKSLGVDTHGIYLQNTLFGYKNEDWKNFRMFDGTEVQISGHMQFDILPNGDIVQYPQGDQSAPPSVTESTLS